MSAAPLLLVAVVLQAGDRSTPDEEAWLPARIADLTAERLRSLGIGVEDRRFFDGSSAGLSGVLRGMVHPAAIAEPHGRIEIDAEMAVPGRRPDKQKVTGKGDALEAIAAELAAFAAGALKVPVPAEAGKLLGGAEYAFDVHRLLGLARAELDAGSDRKAMLTYDRAAKLEKLGAIPEAIDGRALAENALVGSGQSEFGARADLAPPAEERAQVALKHNDDKEAIRALEAFLRYTPERALRWQVEMPLERSTAAVITRGQRWIVQGGEGAKRRWTIDPRTGVVLARDPFLRGLVDVTGGSPLVLDDKTLARLDEQGHVRWKVSLPARPRSLAPDAVDLSSGLAGIIGERSVAWVEVSFGSLAQVATEVRPLTSGTGGVVVEIVPSKGAAGGKVEVGLLRPGKKTPAWAAKIAPPTSAAMTVDRVLFVTGEGLVLLKAHDGKEAGRPLPISPRARILNADGRYAVLALEGQDVAIADVLAGEIPATIQGPSAAVAAYTAAAGAAILFETGDLIFYDRDGKVLDRALAPGEPIDLIRGSPITPGPVAVTTHGLFAYAEVTPDRMRDVDAMVKLAAAFAHTKEPLVAMRWATHVASLSAGRVGEAEAIRAEILALRTDGASKAAAGQAKARAEAAKDAAKALPMFRLP